MKLFNKIYYPLMIILSGAAMICAINKDSTSGAIVGGAFLLFIEIERLGERIVDAIKRYRPPVPHSPDNFKPSVWSGGILKALSKHEEPKETEEQRKQRILDENIERYDGSPKGQIKI
jgi:hypothetical protein